MGDLVQALLDLLAETDRLPFVPLQVLSHIAALPNSGQALQEAGAVPVILGILRGTEDPLLACTAVTFLRRASVHEEIARALCQRSGPKVLLRLLWQGRRHNQLLMPLLWIYDRLLRLPFHRTVLAAEFRLPDSEEVARLPWLLQTLMQDLPGDQN